MGWKCRNGNVLGFESGAYLLRFVFCDPHRRARTKTFKFLLGWRRGRGARREVEPEAAGELGACQLCFGLGLLILDTGEAGGPACSAPRLGGGIPTPGVVGDRRCRTRSGAGHVSR